MEVPIEKLRESKREIKFACDSIATLADQALYSARVVGDLCQKLHEMEQALSRLEGQLLTVRNDLAIIGESNMRAVNIIRQKLEELEEGER